MQAASRAPLNKFVRTHMLPAGEIVVAGAALFVSGVFWSAMCGLVIGFMAARLRMHLHRPVASTVLSYLLACLLYLIGCIPFAAFVFDDYDIMVVRAWFIWFYCLPLLALGFNIRLLRSTTLAATGARIPIRRLAIMIISTQGLLYAAPFAALWLAKVA
jgi:hypothetical protein